MIYAGLLIAHIVVALIMSGAMVATLYSGHRQRISRSYSTMLATFGFTVVSGVGLLIMNAAVLGHVCAMMSVFTLSVIAIRAYYRARLSLVRV